MNHAEIDLGTWYPMGGMGKVMDAMHKLAEVNGRGAHQRGGHASGHERKATGVETANGIMVADIVLATADYHHGSRTCWVLSIALPTGLRRG